MELNVKLKICVKRKYLIFNIYIYILYYVYIYVYTIRQVNRLLTLVEEFSRIKNKKERTIIDLREYFVIFIRYVST